MYSKKKIIRNIFLVSVIFIFVLIMIFSFSDFKQIFDVLINRTNYLYILLAFVMLIVYCCLWQLSFTILIRKKYKEISFKHSMYVAGTEFFFNGITPFSSGGQPFQAYALKSKGMKYSDSTSALLINFLIYQVVINVLALVSLILYYSKLSQTISNLAWLIFIGFSINFFVMILIVSIGTSKFVANLLKKILALFAKIKFLKKVLEPRLVAFDEYVNEVQVAFKELGHQKIITIFVAILKVVAQLIYNAIPLVVFIAIGVNLGINDLFYVIAMTSFALTVAVWVPTPGSSGGMEFAFTTLFSTLLIGYTDSKSLAVSGMLIWRLLTYYLLIVYGLVMYILYERGNK